MGAVGKNRLEAFSDGVFAVAITLLAFNLTVPLRAGGHLAAALGREWPQDAAYVVSFLVIGIIWMNHHTVVARVRRVDRAILIANLFLLLPVVTIPFATDLFATYLRSRGQDGEVAAAVYSGVMTLMAVAFTLLYRAVLREDRYEGVPVDRATARRTTIRFGIGQIVYLALVGVSFLSPVAVLIGQFAVAAFYLLDQTGSSALKGSPSSRGDG